MNGATIGMDCTIGMNRMNAEGLGLTISRLRNVKSPWRTGSLLIVACFLSVQRVKSSISEQMFYGRYELVIPDGKQYLLILPDGTYSQTFQPNTGGEVARTNGNLEAPAGQKSNRVSQFYVIGQKIFRR
jgi:hypothetical protein